MVTDKWWKVLKKLEKKLLKLNKKAQKCITREKALKLLKKYEKTYTALHESSGGDNTLV